VLINYSSDEHTSHQNIYMAEVEGKGNGDPNELLVHKTYSRKCFDYLSHDDNRYESNL
jgi:hypothetical protein